MRKTRMILSCVLQLGLVCVLVPSLSEAGSEKLPKAVNSPEVGPRRKAIRKIVDQTLLARIAFEAEYSEARVMAAEKVTEPALVKKLVIESRDWQVRLVGVEKLTDQDLLATIALNDRDYHVQLGAIERIDNQLALTRIAFEAKDPDVAAAAILKSTDQSVVVKAALETQDLKLRLAAISKLEDRAILNKLRTESSGEIHVAAVKRLVAFAVPILWSGGTKREFLDEGHITVRYNVQTSINSERWRQASTNRNLEIGVSTKNEFAETMPGGSSVEYSDGFSAIRWDAIQYALNEEGFGFFGTEPRPLLVLFDDQGVLRAVEMPERQPEPSPEQAP